ncbi:hypothetical protein Tco_1207844, partial [Tanacetum coccineum]
AEPLNIDTGAVDTCYDHILGLLHKSYQPSYHSGLFTLPNFHLATVSTKFVLGLVESTFACKFFIPIFSAIRRPAISASYSASLLVASNLNLMAYVNSAPSGFVSMRPSPEPSTHDEPSVNNVHGSGSTSGSAMSSSEDSSSGRSTIKSANIWPLIAVLGLYWMSYPSNSNFYFSCALV